MKYRKKPVVVEAFRFGFDPIPKWFFEREQAKGVSYAFDCRRNSRILIYTLEGDMTANKGDYIIKGVKGEIYPCKADIFEATYEKVEE